MKHVIVDLTSVLDWKTFHDAFYHQMEFPGYYGRNMNAWIDCVSDAAPSEELLVISLKGVAELKVRRPEILEAIHGCASFINYREIEIGGPAILALAYSRQ